MGFDVRWRDQSKTILYAKVDGVWTISDFFSLYNDLSTQAIRVAHPIAFKIDLLHVLNMPSHILLAGQYVLDHQPPNLVITVVVSNRVFVTNTFGMFRRAFPALSDQFVIAPSLEAADNICKPALAEAEAKP